MPPKRKNRTLGNDTSLTTHSESEQSCFYFDVNSQIFIDFAQKNYPGKRLALKVGVNKTRERMILMGNKWKHAFNEYEVPENGACLLYAAGVDPDQFFDDLIKNKDNPIIKDILLREMYACFLDYNYLGQRFNAIDSRYVEAAEDYQNTRNNSLIEEYVKKYFCKGHLENYLKKYKEMIKSRTPLWYLRVPASDSARPASLFEALAVLYNLNIAIYERVDIKNPEQLKLRYAKFLSGSPTICHMVYVGDSELNHFNVLIPSINKANNKFAWVQEKLFKNNKEAPVKKQQVNIQTTSFHETIKNEEIEEIILLDDEEDKVFFLEEDDALNVLCNGLSSPKLIDNNDIINNNHNATHMSEAQYQRITHFIKFIGAIHFFKADNYSITLDIIMRRFKVWLDFFSKTPAKDIKGKFLDIIQKFYQEIKKEFPQEMNAVFRQHEWKKIQEQFVPTIDQQQLENCYREHCSNEPKQFFLNRAIATNYSYATLLDVDVSKKEPLYLRRVKVFLCNTFIDLCLENNYELWKGENLSKSIAEKNIVPYSPEVSAFLPVKLTYIDSKTEIPNLFFKKGEKKRVLKNESPINNNNNCVFTKETYMISSVRKGIFGSNCKKQKLEENGDSDNANRDFISN